MAYITTMVRDKFNDPDYHQFQLELLLEIATLPTSTSTNGRCAIGSMAIVEEDFSIWLLCIDNTWKKM